MYTVAWITERFARGIRKERQRCEHPSTHVDRAAAIRNWFRAVSMHHYTRSRGLRSAQCGNEREDVKLLTLVPTLNAICSRLILNA
jgi:hypothetical protein